MARKCSDILAVYPTGDNIVEAALSRFDGPPSHSQIMTAFPPSNLHRPNKLATPALLAREGRSVLRRNDPCGEPATPLVVILDLGGEIRGLARDETKWRGGKNEGYRLEIFEEASARGKSGRTCTRSRGTPRGNGIVLRGGRGGRRVPRMAELSPTSGSRIATRNSPPLSLSLSLSLDDALYSHPPACI